MAVAISVQTQDSWPPRVQVTVTGLTTGNAAVLYRESAGLRTQVRGGVVDNAADPSLVVVDAELPFGVPVSYVVVVDGLDAAATSPTTYALPGGKVALTDAISGDAAEVVITAIGDKARTRPSTRFNVDGRNIVVSGALGQSEGTYELFTLTTSGHQSLMALLDGATEGVVHIRNPGVSLVSGEPYDGIDAYLAVDKVTERRWSQDGSDPRRLTTIEWAEVDGWSDALVARGYTLQDIADYFAGDPVAVRTYTFATDTDTWSGSGGSVARVATPSQDGNGSLQWTMPSANVPRGLQTPTGFSALPIPAPGNYLITYRVMTPNSLNPVNFKALWFESFGDFIPPGSAVTVTLVPNVWTTVTLEAGSLPLAARVRIDVSLDQTTSGDLLYLDSVTVQRIPGTLQDVADFNGSGGTLLDIAQADWSS